MIKIVFCIYIYGREIAWNWQWCNDQEMNNNQKLFQLDQNCEWKIIREMDLYHWYQSIINLGIQLERLSWTLSYVIYNALTAAMIVNVSMCQTIIDIISLENHCQTIIKPMLIYHRYG